MRKLAVLYSGDSRGLNGAALYVDRFRKHANIFRAYNIDPVICDSGVVPSNIDEEQVIEIETAYANSKKHHLKNRIKTTLSKTYIGSLFFIYKAWDKPGKQAVEKNSSIIEESDLILSNDMYSAFYVKQKYPEKKMFFVMHNSGILLKMLLDRLPKIQGTKKEKQLHIIERKIFKHAKGILFVSRKARDTFSECFPEFQEKAIYVPEGIEDVDKVPELIFNSLKLVCVGTVCERKNQLELVKAYKELDNKNVDLTIIGGGTLLNECKTYATQNDIKNIVFTGPVKNKDIPELLCKSNAFILASKDEGLPAVGIEALRSGLPILITDVGGCAELVKDNGFVLSGTDKSSIQDGITKMLANMNKLKDMSVNSRKLYEREFSIEAMVKAYSEIMDI